METTDDFVLLARSASAQYIDQVASMLEAEGIPYEHPGRNHAALLPGFTYIEIQLRVPRSRYEEARALLVALEDPSASGKTAFRVRRSRAYSDMFLGTFLGMAATLVAAALRLHNSPVVALSLLGAGSVGGFLVGRTRHRDHCSNPSCGGFLPPSADVCPKCGATLRGIIASDADHFAAVEASEKAASQASLPPGDASGQS
jgi:hypothetical protein